MSKLAEWKRERITTNMAGENISALQDLAAATGISMGRLLDQALEKFLIDAGVREREITPRIDLKHLRELLKEHK
jgi:hypothetical protein